MHPPLSLPSTYGDIHPSCTGLALVFALAEIVIFLLSHCPRKCCIVPDKWRRAGGSNFVCGDKQFQSRLDVFSSDHWREKLVLRNSAPSSPLMNPLNYEILRRVACPMQMIWCGHKLFLPWFAYWNDGGHLTICYISDVKISSSKQDPYMLECKKYIPILRTNRKWDIRHFSIYQK